MTQTRRPAPKAENGTSGWVDEVISELARRQHGVVERAQLLAAGIAVHAIDYRVRVKRLVPVAPGVYRVGPLDSEYVHPMAAVLACGAGAVISHWSAARLWGLVREERPWQPVHVIAAGARRQPRTRIIVHRCGLARGETTHHLGIPVTRPARTLLDLAAEASDADLEHAVATAERQRLVTVERVRALVGRHQANRGAARLRALVGNAVFTRSEGEAWLRGLLRRAELPEPLANRRACGMEVDFIWSRERLIAEVDGFTFHGSRTAFEKDRARDAILAANGYVVLRITWRQLTERPEWVVARIAQALSARRDGTAGDHRWPQVSGAPALHVSQLQSHDHTSSLSR